MTELYILDIIHDTTVDGPGFRTSIYSAGCQHKCPECHNPQSWDVQNGHPMTISSLMDEIVSDPFAHVTFSGGDPMFQAQGFAQLARRIKAETDKTIWCYTGFTWEGLSTNADAQELLDYVDVLVDGPFMKALRDEELLFRGSSNQRLIDVAASRAAGHVVEWKREQPF